MQAVERTRVELHLPVGDEARQHSTRHRLQRTGIGRKFSNFLSGSDAWRKPAKKPTLLLSASATATSDGTAYLWPTQTHWVPSVDSRSGRWETMGQNARCRDEAGWRGPLPLPLLFCARRVTKPTALSTGSASSRPRSCRTQRWCPSGTPQYPSRPQRPTSCSTRSRLSFGRRWTPNRR